MNKFSKIVPLSFLLAVSLFADDKSVIDFEKDRISQNPNVQVKDIQINTKKVLPLEGWTGYILDVKANVQGKDIDAKDIVFANGKYIALDLIDSEKGTSLKDLVTPNLSANYYDKSKLIAGNHNAKDKIVIFSDPLCPFCMDYVPDVIKYVKENKDNIALYYYHFPLLRLHPAAGPLSRIIEVAKHKGVEDVELRVYKTDWEKYFTNKETDEKKILEAFNKEFNTKITLAEIQDKKVQASIDSDTKKGEDVMVGGTPTIFVNGEKDSLKDKYLTLGKK